MKIILKFTALLILCFYSKALYAQGALVLKSTASTDVLFYVFIDKNDGQDMVRICKDSTAPNCSTSTLPLLGNYDV
ncbi:MAG: hypothetical protein ABIQ93_11945, partial [Saprospiraceae bacterium]